MHTFGGPLCTGHYSRCKVCFICHHSPLSFAPRENAEAWGVRRQPSALAGAGQSTGDPPTLASCRRRVKEGTLFCVPQPKSEGTNSLFECLDRPLSGHVPQHVASL